MKKFQFLLLCIIVDTELVRLGMLGACGLAAIGILSKFQLLLCSIIVDTELVRLGMLGACGLAAIGILRNFNCCSVLL